MQTYQVSVIMPALNEERNIPAALDDVEKTFKRLNIKGEIIVIDDGSTDNTTGVVKARQLANPDIKLVSHPRNRGFGAAFWSGVKRANGDIVLCMPGDGENDSFEILRYIHLMDHVDLVIPYIYNTQNRSLTRRIVSKTYKAIINMTFGMLLNYMNGTVMYRRAVLENVELKSFGFFFQTELLIKSIRKGFLYAEVPCAIKERQSGRSTALSLKSFVRVVKGYVQTLMAVYFVDRLQAHNLPLQSITQQRWQFLEKKS